MPVRKILQFPFSNRTLPVKLAHANHRWPGSSKNSESSERTGRASDARSRQTSRVQQPRQPGRGRTRTRALCRNRRIKPGMSEPRRGIGAVCGEILSPRGCPSTKRPGCRFPPRKSGRPNSRRFCGASAIGRVESPIRFDSGRSTLRREKRWATFHVIRAAITRRSESASVAGKRRLACARSH